MCGNNQLVNCNGQTHQYLHHFMCGRIYHSKIASCCRQQCPFLAVRGYRLLSAYCYDRLCLSVAEVYALLIYERTIHI